MPIRRNFQQYVNLRPVRLFEGVPSPLATPGAIDFMIVRENNEGEYSEVGGRMFPGTDQEMVIQDTVLTRHGCDRVMRFAFELSRSRKKKLTSATKSNGIIHTMPFWDERFRAVAQVLSRRRHRAVPYRHPDRAFRAQAVELRRGGGRQSVRRHPVRPRAGGDRHHRHRAIRQSQSGAALSLDVRAGARLGARHRRPEHRQPDRPDLVGRDDARASRRQGCRRRPSSRRSSASWHPAKTSPATWAAPLRPRRSAQAIADAVSVHPAGKAAAHG